MVAQRSAGAAVSWAWNCGCAYDATLTDVQVHKRPLHLLRERCWKSSRDRIVECVRGIAERVLDPRHSAARSAPWPAVTSRDPQFDHTSCPFCGAGMTKDYPGRVRTFSCGMGINASSDTGGVCTRPRIEWVLRAAISLLPPDAASEFAVMTDRLVEAGRIGTIVEEPITGAGDRARVREVICAARPELFAGR
jgi:hypothetical protein